MQEHCRRVLIYHDNPKETRREQATTSVTFLLVQRASNSLAPLEPERRSAVARPPLLPGGGEPAASCLFVVVLHVFLLVLGAEPDPALGFPRARRVGPEGRYEVAALALAPSRRDVYVSFQPVGSALGRPTVS